MVLKWYILYINGGNLQNIPQKGGNFQTGPMNFDATMKFISKFGYFKIFFSFQLNILTPTVTILLINTFFQVGVGTFLMKIPLTRHVLSHNCFLTISGGCQRSKPVTAQQTSYVPPVSVLTLPCCIFSNISNTLQWCCL